MADLNPAGIKNLARANVRLHPKVHAFERAVRDLTRRVTAIDRMSARARAGKHAKMWGSS